MLPPPATWAQGVALLDLDDDGDLDLALGTGFSDTRLWENDGEGTFAMVGEPLPRAAAVAAGDIDGDGVPELFLGRGESMDDEVAFLDGRESNALEGSEGHTTGGSFADFDGDGDLDLAISRHIEVFDPATVATGEAEGGGNELRRNDELLFVKVEGALSDALSKATSFQALWINLDNDGIPDLYWVNDFGWWTHPNALLRGMGDGRFSEQEDSGAELATATMGVSAGDVDGDGFFDLWSSDAGSPDLLLGDGDEHFYDAGQATGSSVPMDDERVSSRGTAIVDLDLDGLPELLAAYGPINFFTKEENAGGIVLPGGEELDDPDAQRSLLLHQLSDGTFEDLSEQTGFGLLGIQRSILAADLDADGRPEVITTGWLDRDRPLLRIWRVQGGCDPGLTVRIDRPARYDGAILTATYGSGRPELRRPLHHGAAFSSGSLETSVPFDEDGNAPLIRVDLPDGSTLSYEQPVGNMLVVRPWE